MKSIVAMLAVIMVPAAVTVAADCQTTKSATYPNPHTPANNAQCTMVNGTQSQSYECPVSYTVGVTVNECHTGGSAKTCDKAGEKKIKVYAGGGCGTSLAEPCKDPVLLDDADSGGPINDFDVSGECEL